VADDGIVQLRKLELFLAAAVVCRLGVNSGPFGSGRALGLEEGE